jgi:hypothetical protein
MDLPDLPSPPREAVVFALTRSGHYRSCWLADLGPHGVEARVCDGDMGPGFFVQRFETLTLALVWAEALLAEMVAQGWVEEAV